MYNGVHTLDQVIYGGLIGIWIGFLGEGCIREKLFKHVDELYANTKIQVDYKGCVMRGTVCVAFGILTCNAAYFYCLSTFEVPAIWLQRQREKSGDPGIFTLANSSYIQSASLGMPYAMYLGILYSHLKHQSGTTTLLPLSIPRQLMRVALFGLLLGTAYLPYVAFFHHFSAHVFQAMTFTMMLPLSAVCFIGSAFFETHVYAPLGLSSHQIRDIEKKKSQ